MTTKPFPTLTPAPAPSPDQPAAFPVKPGAPAAAKSSDAIFYPETDGEPLPDGQHQGPLFRAIVDTLAVYFRGRPDVSVNGNTFIYYEEGNPRRHIAPDCYVAFEVDVAAILARNIYLLWEVGKPPDFVLEIGSESTATVDTGSKRIRYAEIGCGEYWRYDATGGDFYGEPLVGEYLADGEYRRFELRRDADETLWGYSPALGLDLCWDQGRLRFYDPATGQWLRNYEETQDELTAERTARTAAESRATDAESRLATERAARDAAESRAAQLEAELRRLRGETP